MHIVNKKVVEPLNDGMLYLGTKRTVRDNSNNIVDSEFDIKIELCYKQKTMREKDISYFAGIGQRIDLKVKTYNTEFILDDRTADQVKVKGQIYNITHTDVDQDRMFMYLYLTKEE